jgi:PGF-pre-PGF domain-containing protein
MLTNWKGSRVTVQLLLVIIVVSSISIQTCKASSAYEIASIGPPDGANVTGPGPITLSVAFRNGTDHHSVFPTGPYQVLTEYWVTNPDGDKLVGSGWGSVSATFNPPFAGTYRWYVKTAWSNGATWFNYTFPGAGLYWSFTCLVATTTTTQMTTTTVVPQTTATVTQTVGVVTEYSYLYETITSPKTTYMTQTVSTTRTMSSQTTIMKTSTAFATTETTPITYYQTQSTTMTETLYGTISITQYVYVDSYVQGQVIESATIQEIPSESQGSAQFNKGDQHKIEAITIGVVSNVTNVKIAIGTDPDHPSLGTNMKEYESFQIAATNLPDQDIKSTRIEFKVDRNWLSDNQIPQEKVVLYRLENGEWRALQTSLLKTDDTYAYYEAASPGLSIFAIAGQSTSFFQIPGIGLIPNSYVMILALIMMTIVGVYGTIRIKRARSRSKKEGNGSDPAPANTSSEPQIEERLLEYITKHGGSISLSKAAEDLGVLPVSIKEALGHLKNGGKLTPA